MIAIQCEKYWISAAEGFQRKPCFLPSLPAEYVTAFSGETDSPDDLTNRRRDRVNYSDPHCARVARVKNTVMRNIHDIQIK